MMLLLIQVVETVSELWVIYMLGVREIEFQHPSFIEKQDEKNSFFYLRTTPTTPPQHERRETTLGRGKDKQKKTRQRIVFHMAIGMI